MTDSEVERHYTEHVAEFQAAETVRVSQIVIATREEAAQLRDRLRREPQNFADIARRLSIAPEGKNGGDLGYIVRGGGFPEVFDLCFSLPKNVVSDVTPSPYGFHLFKVTDRKPAQRLTLEQVRGQVLERLGREKRARAQTEYLATLRKRAHDRDRREGARQGEPLSPILALAVPIAAALLAQRGAVIDRVAATVDGDVITLGELVERSGEEYSQAEALPAGPAREAARRKALRRAFDDAVAEKLLATQAAELGLEATEAQVDAAIEDIKKRNGLDEARLDEALVQQGLDRAAFRRQVKGNLQTYNVLGYKVRNRVKVTDDDLRNHYQRHASEFAGEEEVHVRHVFLPLAEGASAAEEAKVRALGQKVLQRLAAGEDFAAVAKEVSKGPGRRTAAISAGCVAASCRRRSRTRPSRSSRARSRRSCARGRASTS